MTGKVWLVGAGPGDAGLLTLRGKEVLGQAEVVVYDALTGAGVRSMIPEGAKLYYAGKRAGNHAMKQEDINRVILEEAGKGLRVVRLKGGDPFLFGRGGEELELLSARGIPFEVVPGVPSAFAVPAYAGIPVTHRDCCSDVHIIAGNRRRETGGAGAPDEPDSPGSGKGPGAGKKDLDYDVLAKLRGTLVFLMGVSSLPEICRGLLEAGMNHRTPAALLEKGTTAGQRRISATLGTLEEEARTRHAGAPAVIVIGDVCRYADTLSWAEKRPLSGVTVVLTRPEGRSAGLAARLGDKGAEVIELPSIKLRPLPDTEPLKREIRRTAEGYYDWLVFTSPSGAGFFFDALLEEGDARTLSAVKIAALGDGTRKELLARGIRADFLPSVYDTETLGRELAGRLKPGSRVLIPRAAAGSPALTKELLKADRVQVTDLPVYETEALPVFSRGVSVREILEHRNRVLAVFTSASTVRGFAAAAGEENVRGMYAACIGKQTEEAAVRRGMRTFVSRQATEESLAECILEAARRICKEEGGDE